MYQESVWNPDLGNGFYQNPVINQDIPDPTVIRDGETFYYCGSTGMHFPSLAIYTSKDLVNWSFLCHPFPKYNGNVWAPELIQHEGKYYLYFAANGGDNFVSVSEHIDHGWCDPIDLKVGHIDPGHCVYNGKRYLFLSSNYAAPLSDDGLRVTGELKCVCPAQPLPDEWDIEGAYPESPKLLKHGDWYYLIYADGGTGGPATAHAVMCARAKNPIDGPWEYSPYNPMVHTWSRDEKWCAKGHGCMVDDVTGKWWILYHAYEKGYMNQGRKVLLEPVVFTEDGWPVIEGGCSAEMPRKKPAGEALPCKDSLSDSFEKGLHRLWLMYNAHDYGKLTAQNGILTMKACQAPTPGHSHPISITPGDHCYSVETTLYKPEEGCEAGVILFYDESYYGALGWKGDKLLLYRLGKVLMRFDVKTEKLKIKMRNDRHYVAFYIAEDDQPYRKLNYVQNVEPMCAAAYGGFASLRAGLYAVGEGEAKFGPFIYQSWQETDVKG